MAATAKKSSSSDVRGSSSFSESDEDIASIAKQISDHAEAIYQTWKSRGLAPTEILNCRPDTDNTFSKTLSPTSPTPRNIESTAELLAKAPDLSNNNLKELVDSFVNEDKARIAAQNAAGQLSPTGSSASTIKYKLKKFENLSNQSQPLNSSPEPISIPFIKPHFVNTSNKLSSSNNNKPLEQKQPQQQHVPDVLKDTIDKVVRREKPETPQKPEHLLNHVPTWPLKNRNLAQPNRNEMKNPEKNLAQSQPSNTTVTSGTPSIQTAGRNLSVLKDPQKHIDVMDEVTREEEKLINALKTGTVLNENSSNSLPEVITSSLTDNQFIKADQQNGVATTVVDGNLNDTNSNNSSTNLASSTVTPPPQKPNHTPIFVHHKEENTKSFKNFTHVATTRIPTRSPSGSDVNVVFPQKDKDFQLKSAPSPVRPFLSRGSVAERVLIFEKCPEPKTTPARAEVKAVSKLQVSYFFLYNLCRF
jgi:serine/threonine-protein phosphatase 2A regulatory subunit B''